MAKKPKPITVKDFLIEHLQVGIMLSQRGGNPRLIGRPTHKDLEVLAKLHQILEEY